MQREKNKRYFLDQLQPGDRFYFIGDRYKNIYTVNLDLPFETIKQAGFNIKYCHCLKDGSTTGERHKANRPVIFLRNILLQ